MCSEGSALLSRYLDAAEEYDRRHLMLLAAFRARDPQATEGFRNLVREAQRAAHTACGRFREHQKGHGCCEAIRLDDDPVLAF